MLIPLLGVTWLVGSHQVTLQVDGRQQQLTTHARTVGELLDRAGVRYGEADEVVPDPETRVRNGMVVEVVHAREITLLIDGQEQTVLVTALSVDEVIDQIAQRRGVTQRSLVRPSRLTAVTSGMTVEVLNPVGVTVVADGKTRNVVTDAPTVAGVLGRLGIALDADDRVTPEASAPVEAGFRIIVERVRVERQHREVAIEYDTEQRPTDDLAAGEEREVQAGRDGIEKVVERVTFVDGEEVRRIAVRRQTVTEPQTRIVEVGTATQTPPDADEPEHSDSTENDEPARSAPPPQPDPQPEPEPDPAPEPSSSSQSGQASYYYHPEEGMTAAHRTLPIGTVVTVTNQANGKSIRVTINDRGPYIDGRVIDLNEPAFTQIAAKSSGVINVRITW